MSLFRSTQINPCCALQGWDAVLTAAKVCGPKLAIPTPCSALCASSPHRRILQQHDRRLRPDAMKNAALTDMKEHLDTIVAGHSQLEAWLGGQFT